MNMKEITVGDLIERRIRPGTTFGSGDVLYYNRLICMGGKNGKILFDTSKNKTDFIRQYYPGIISAMWVEIREWNGKSAGFGPQTYEAVLLCYVEHESWKKIVPEEELERSETVNILLEMSRNEEATVKYGVHEESIKKAKRRVQAIRAAIESIEREGNKDG